MKYIEDTKEKNNNIQSTFFILGARETNGENTFIISPYFSASHPNTLSSSTPPLNNIHGNTGRDKKRSVCFHKFSSPRIRKNFCSATLPTLSLPSYNTGWFGYTLFFGAHPLYGVSSHLSSMEFDKV